MRTQQFLDRKGIKGIKVDKGDDGTSLKLLGTKATVDDLPDSDNEQGDMWIVEADGNAYAWDGSAWNNVGDITGPKGDSGTIVVAGTETLPAGSDAEVTDSDSDPSNANLTFKIPKGDTGAKGDAATDYCWYCN